MSNVKYFLKANKKVKPNVKYIASENFTDEEGNPIEWEIKPLSTADNERIREECTTIIETNDKGYNQYAKVDARAIMAKQAISSIVFPDLYNAELQDSYGVMTPEDLLFKMLDNAGDYQRLILFIQKYNKLNVSMDEKIEKAKNS